jgi:Fic family protein
MLIGPLLRREALTSSAMEGTITTLGDMLLDEAGDEPASKDDAREATNYGRAIRASIDMLDTLPIYHRLIKQAHSILLSGLSPERGANKRPGEYKAHQNAVGRRGDIIATARYVPPPPQQTIDCMDQLEAYINRECIDPAYRIIDLGLTHYQFEAIHPFDDGNGRIGRMLITLLAQQSGLLELPTLHISAYLENRKNEYIDRLFAVSSHGKWNEWMVFFLEVVTHCAADATQIVDKIIGLQASLRTRVHDLGKPHYRFQTIVDSLFEQAWTTATQTQERSSVSFPTAQSDLRTLVAAGILREIPGPRATIYFSPEIIELSNRPTG